MLLVKYKSIFDTVLYTKNNRDLQHITTHSELWQHALNYGVYEGRPIFSDYGIDRQFYIAVTLHRYSSLDLDFYRLANEDLRSLPDYELCRHYHDFGHREGRITSLERTHKTRFSTADIIALKASLYWINTSDSELTEGVLFHGINHTKEAGTHCYLIHIYNIDRLESILAGIDLTQDIVINFDFVNLLKYDVAEILERYRMFERSVIIRTQFNVGIDILPQLRSYTYLQGLGLKYSRCTILHSKSDEGLLNRCMSYLRENAPLEGTGILCPPEILVSDTLVGSKNISSKYYLVLLANLYGISLDDNTKFSFCGGTLMNVATEILDLLVSRLPDITKYFNTFHTIDYNWKICVKEKGVQYNNNIDCRNQGIDILPDGMFEHAIERFLGVIAVHLELDVTS